MIDTYLTLQYVFSLTEKRESSPTMLNGKVGVHCLLVPWKYDNTPCTRNCDTVSAPIPIDIPCDTQSVTSNDNNSVLFKENYNYTFAYGDKRKQGFAVSERGLETA